MFYLCSVLLISVLQFLVMKCRKFQIDTRMSKKHSWSVGLLILYQG